MGNGRQVDDEKSKQQKHGQDDNPRRAHENAKPGKTTRVIQEDRKLNEHTGDPYIDHGAVCDDDGAGGTCFLSSDQRLRLISSLSHRIQEASTNFKVAATQVQFEKLIERDEELSPLATFLLDFVGGFIGLKLATSLMNLKAGGVAGLKNHLDVAEMTLVDPSKTVIPAMKALQAVSDDHVKAGVGALMRGAGIQAYVKLKLEKNKARSMGVKAQTADLLNSLVTQATNAFALLRERLPFDSDDATLLVQWKSFAVENHLIEQYKDDLRAKIERYHESGVKEIDTGLEKGATMRDSYLNDGHALGTYVVWNSYVSGYPKRLVYQHAGRQADAKDKHGHTLTKTEYNTKSWEGMPAEGRGHGKPGTGTRGNQLFVPEEFADMAIEKHKNVWGHAPIEEIVDDRHWDWDPARAKQARERYAKAQGMIKKAGGPGV